ncbi:lytic transglycosylase domain-containing protein [Aquabacter spiritensis]|uniref:Soluble lytic murein transglycosylase n=1 Tax=Aquabacter spiritensis TaxID=933073 RepID=A0A4R3LSZ7_9HYPH|nr:lytic transglycosylase domain-containing protein [Aquabacter spiritensis]TCT03501.1 soluble lytic murein transglycosylase [Aquabacter spiritensis]
MLRTPSLVSRAVLALALACAVPASAAPDPKDGKTSTASKSPAAKPSAAPKPATKPTAKSTAASASKTAPKTPPKPAPKGTSVASSIPAAAPAPVVTGELSTLRSAVSLAKGGKGREALAAAQGLSDPVARHLVTWLAIRHAPNDLGFDAINAFMQDKPYWPTPATLRRKAEAVLFVEKPSPAVVRTFFGEQAPLSGPGKIVLARALVANGDTQTAGALVRDAWRTDDLSESSEQTVLAEFGPMLSRADHKARADRFSYNPDTERAMRAAARAGSDVVALTKARLAIARRESNGASLLSQVPMTLAGDPAYLFAKAQLARRADQPQEAAKALLAAPNSAAAQVDTDQWWIERRLVARELLDAGDARTAYRVAAAAATPEADNYRAESQFTAGWIALRFLKDPRTAATHFSRIAEGQTNPITLSRAAYWQARASEAMGDTGTARALYEAAGRHSVTYYGQLARIRLGLPPVALRRTPDSSAARANFERMEPVRAIKLLYAIGDRDTPMTIYYDLAWRLRDSGQLALLAQLAEAHSDARGALVVGKESVYEGHPLDAAAFPTFGLPSYSPIGTPVDKAMIYAIARQESQFNPRTLSSAKAMGLMQVTPAAGRQVAKVTGATYNEARLMNDQSYNVQFGAAELGELVDAYDGNPILIFAAYNAGRGSVRKWFERYGDPRDKDVDPIDWVESIPFSETRNYVQRVFENYNVYQVRFGISQPVASATR